VQHIASGFTAGLVAWLSQKTHLLVKVAERGEVIQPGNVYFASEGFQMGLTAGRISMENTAIENGFCPSVSSLFRSVAEAYGPSAMGILLTGMGKDGAVGLKRLREAGGTTLAQNEESSVVFGMPKEAICLGAVEYVLSPEQIAGMIRALGCTTERGDHRGG
jgi:two-component system chemotaxis response regulator CheB